MYRIASIDSGASKTDIIIYSDDGYLYLTRLNISLNIHNIPKPEIEGHLEEIIRILRRQKVEKVVWGLAGLDTEKDYRTWEILLSSYSDFSHHILHDVEMALYAVDPSGRGLLVVAGTGSNVYGFDGENKVKCGDWGALYGDDFSGYRLGREFLNLILRIYDGRLDDKYLMRDFIDYLGIKREEIPNWIYESSISQVASLSKYICSKVEYGYVRNIMDKILMEMEIALKSVILKLSLDTPIHYTGGLFKCSYIMEGLKNICKRNRWTLGTYIEYPVIGGISYLLSIEGLREDALRNKINTIYTEVRRRIT